MESNTIYKNILTITSLIALLLFVGGGIIVQPKVAMAANLTSMSDTLSPATGATNAEKASTVANHTIVFTTPTGIAGSSTIILTFDNSTSIAASFDFNDVDIKDNGSQVTNTFVSGTSPSAAQVAVSRTSATVLTITFGSGVSIVATHAVSILLGTHTSQGATGTHQITNGSAGTTLLTISGTFGDTGTIAMPIIADDVVVVNAIVPPTISFTISDNTIFFGNLRAAGICFAQGSDPGAVTCPTTTETEAFNMTAATNATTGYTITAQGATLTSGGNTITALGSNTASSTGTEQFGIRATASGGVGAVQSPFAAAGYAWTPTASTAVTLASASGPSATTTYSVRYMANIAAVTEAGTYTASHTYVATGTF